MMKSDEPKPYIAARWYEGREHQLQSSDTNVAVSTNDIDTVRHIYQLADGTRAVSQIAADSGTSLDELITLVNQLTSTGLCFDGRSAAMFGHNLTKTPHPLTPPEDLMLPRPTLSIDEGRRLKLKGEIDAIDSSRASKREFSNARMRFEDFCGVLLSAYGITRNDETLPRRTTPSAGGMYPLQLHVFTLSVEELPTAQWRFANHATNLFTSIRVPMMN